MTPETYRLSAHEMRMFSHLSSLEQRVHVLTEFLAQNFPFMRNDHRFPTPNNYFTGVGSTMLGVVTDHDILTGRGPRFVAKYNLAANDVERQMLLGSLPDLSQRLPFPIVDRHQHVFAEYRPSRLTHTTVQRRPIVAEWTAVTTRVRRGDVPLRDGYQTHGIMVDTTYRSPELREILADVPFDPNSVHFIVRLPTAGGTSAEVKTLVAVPEIQGYLSFNEDNLRPQHTIFWSEHEQCWAATDGVVCSEEAYGQTLDLLASYLDLPPMPPIEHQCVLFDAVLGVAQRFNQQCLDQLRETAEELRRQHADPAHFLFGAEGLNLVIRASIRGDTSNYTNMFTLHWAGFDPDYPMYQDLPLLRDMHDYQLRTGTVMPVAEEAVYQRIPHRQWAMLLKLLREFAQHPNLTLTRIEDADALPPIYPLTQTEDFSDD